KWSFAGTGNAYGSSPAIGADGTIYVGSMDFNLYALADNGTSAAVRWAYDIGYWEFSSPAISADGTIIVGSEAGLGLFALNPDGTLKWNFAPPHGPTGEPVMNSSPAIASNGTVYISSEDSLLYAVGYVAPTPTATVTTTQSPTRTATATATPITSVNVSPASCGGASVVEGNTSTSCVFTLNNTGFTNHLMIDTIVIDDAIDYGVFFTDCMQPGGVPAQSSCNINVAFTPQSIGAYTTHMHVTDNATSSPQTVTITGTGTLPPNTTDTITPNPLDFGDSVMGQASEQFITVENTGFTNPLVLQTVTLPTETIGYSGPHEFLIVPNDSSCPAPPAGIGPGSSCIIAIDLFVDTSIVDATTYGSLAIADNTAGSPETVNFTGYGVYGINGTGDCYTTATGACDATQSRAGFSGQSCLVDSGTCTTVAGPGCNCL
ncbi:MAG TPA: PQQ-binding-like beta-propeller repeat protein, partial [Candidatus Binataceae bacterium]|nr:PQQ-binding-like beta-propeller repeat protein [Candidatus Binataceae bacterium]